MTCRTVAFLLLLASGILQGCSSPSSLQRAEAAYEVGHYDRAIAWSSKAIEEKPGAPAAHLVRGKCYEKKGDPIRAIADYEVVRREAPDRGEPVLREARCYLAAGRPAEAEATLAKAIKEHFEEYSVRDRMMTLAAHGEVRLAVGDFPRASDSLDQALRVAQGSRPLEVEGCTAAVHYNLSRALYEQGSYPRARESFQAYLQAQKRAGESPRPQDLYTLTVLHFLCEDIAAAKALTSSLSPEYKAQAEAFLSGDTFSVRALYDLRHKPKEKDQDSDSNP